MRRPAARFWDDLVRFAYAHDLLTETSRGAHARRSAAAGRAAQPSASDRCALTPACTPSAEAKVALCQERAASPAA